MLVVTEVLSIASEKVTDIVLLTGTPLSLSLGETEKTVGAVVSVVVLSVEVVSSVDEVLSEVVLSSSELLVVEDELSLDEEPPSSLPQEIMVKLKRNRESIISKCFTWFPNWLL